MPIKTQLTPQALPGRRYQAFQAKMAYVPPIPVVPYLPPFVAAEYALWLTHPDGTRLKLLTASGPQADVLRLEYIRVVNTPGVMAIQLRDDSILDLVQEDSRIYVERRLPAGSLIDTDTFWWIRNWETAFERGAKTVDLNGVYSAAFTLAGPIVAYAAGTSQASKSGEIDDMMKALVRENLGSLVTDTTRQIDLLSVAADTTAGPSSSGQSFSRKNVLATLQDLSAEAKDLGTPVYFDVDANFTFQTYPGQRGSDHGQSSGQPLVLSVENGTLTKVRRSYQTAHERNFIYSGGPNTGDNRLVGTASDQGRIDISPVNRRELWRDQTAVKTQTDLDTASKVELVKHRPREVFEVEMADTPALRYGRDWNFGDRVVVDYEGVRDALVNEVRILLNNGQEMIKTKLVVE